MDYNLALLFIIALVLIIGSFIYMLNRFFAAESAKRNYELRMKYSENLLPNRLQAYERMILFLERIRPASLVRRIASSGTSKEYEYLLIDSIQNEFEHNLAQQLYINPETWKIIISAKNATQLLIKKSFESFNESASVKEVQENIIKQILEEEASPSSTAISYLQRDIQGAI